MKPLVNTIVLDSLVERPERSLESIEAVGLANFGHCVGYSSSSLDMLSGYPSERRSSHPMGSVQLGDGSYVDFTIAVGTGQSVGCLSCEHRTGYLQSEIEIERLTYVRFVFGVENVRLFRGATRY